MKTVKDLFDLLGRDRLAREGGFSQQVLSRALSENVMPSSWRDDINSMCVRAGITCPDHLFKWRRTRRGDMDVHAPDHATPGDALRCCNRETVNSEGGV